MSIQKKSLISTLKSAKKANVVKEEVTASPVTAAPRPILAAKKLSASRKLASKHAPARKLASKHAPARKLAAKHAPKIAV